MAEKLETINSQLPLTGNNIVTAQDDGSPEWIVASAAYDNAVAYLLGEHDWKFATQIASPARTGDSTDEDYDDAYAKPVNSLGLIWVKVEGEAIDYKIVGNQIVCNAANGISVKYVLEPGPEEWPPLFVNALKMLVRAGIYEGLNEDPVEARRLEAQVETLYLAKARSRSDREEKPRARFVSTSLQRRRGIVSGLQR